MMQTSQPDTKDTAPAIRELAREWLYDADLPVEWEDSVAREFNAALNDRKFEILLTHREGRPADMPVVEWQAQR